MADECIHGFDDGMCAVCFPPAEPAAAPRARAPRERLSRLTDPVRPVATAAAPAARVAGAKASVAGVPDRPIELRNLRIYHLTHLDNLARILGAGAVLADAEGAEPVVDLSAPAAREFRRAARIPGIDRPVAEYVPFFLTSEAHLWAAVRDGHPDARLAANAHERPAADHVFVVGTVGQAAGALAEQPGTVVVTDRDASAAGGDVEIDRIGVERLLRSLHREGNEAALGGGEFLVHRAYPLERVAFVAVATERVRDRVRAALQAVGAKTRVVVYPPWFREGGPEAGE